VAAIKKESDNAAYQLWLEENKDRQLLKKRIEAIRQEHIMEIKIALQDMIEKRFFSHKPMLKPRHQRDIKWLFSLIKSFALLNLWWRDRHDSTITASNDDIELGFVLWDKISRSQDFNLPPFIYSLYQEVILPAWKEKNGIIDEDSIDTRDKIGISRQEIFEKHYKVYGRMVDTCQLRQQILPMLETAGLITQEPDSLDKRRILIYPTMLTTISETQKYSGDGCGVNENNSCLDTP